jgi:hypothetical protein
MVLAVKGDALGLIGWDAGNIILGFIVQGRSDRGLRGQGIELPWRHHLCLGNFGDKRNRTGLHSDSLPCVWVREAPQSTLQLYRVKQRRELLVFFLGLVRLVRGHQQILGLLRVKS